MGSRLYTRVIDDVRGESPKKMRPNFKLHQKVMAWELISVLAIFICIFLGSPVGQWEFNSWPVYSNSFLEGITYYAMGYVVGTWAWIAVIEGFMQAYAEEKVD